MNTQPTHETNKISQWSDSHGWIVDIDFARKLERERDEAREYADKLAEGLPDGMLPKDVEVLREANLGLATELAAVTAQRDMLAEALRKVSRAWNYGEVAQQALQSLTLKP
jgi:kynureninase